MVVQLETVEAAEPTKLYRDDRVHWYSFECPPIREPNLALHPDGRVTLESRTFPLDEEIDGFEFGPGLIAWRSLKLRQTLNIEFDGERYSCVFDHTHLCGWRCFGFKPVLILKNSDSGEYWLLTYDSLTSKWLRVTPCRGEYPGLETPKQLKRVIGLLVLGGFLIAAILYPASVWLGVCAWALGH